MENPSKDIMINWPSSRRNWTLLGLDLVLQVSWTMKNTFIA
jgi:hypothetical protein